VETTAQIVPLKQVTYEQFKEFLDSLDEEKKTWSLDLQNLKNDKEFYDGVVYVMVCVYDKEVIGLCSCYENGIFPKMVEVSFVVKKGYQGQGIGTMLLKRVEWDAKRETSYKLITAKHYKDNIASHKAFLKAGYKEWEGYDGAWGWKIKEIG